MFVMCAPSMIAASYREMRTYRHVGGRRRTSTSEAFLYQFPVRCGQQALCSCPLGRLQQAPVLYAAATLQDGVRDGLRLQALIEYGAHVALHLGQLDEGGKRRSSAPGDGDLDVARVD